MTGILSQLLVPIFTFFLGMYAHVALKKWEIKRATRRDLLGRVSLLCAQWYQQVRELIDTEQALARSEYLESRIVLPHLLETLEGLREIGRDKKVVAAIEEFLSLLTVNSLEEVRTATRSHAWHIRCSYEFEKLIMIPNPQTTADKYKFVASVDRQLQSINRLVGRALAR